MSFTAAGERRTDVAGSGTRLKILVLQLRRLGDLIQTTPALVAVRQQLPRSEVTLAIAPESAALLPALGNVAQSVIVPGHQAWRRLRRVAADCVIDCTSNDRSALLSAISAAPRRIASDQLKRKSWIRSLFYNEFVSCAVKEMHTADYILALHRPLGIEGASAALQLHLPARAIEQAALILEEKVDHRPFAIFHPGSARADKFWVAERWAEVIRFAARELGLAAFLTGGPDGVEAAHLADIRHRLPLDIIDLSGKIDLLTLAALIGRAQLLVTVDSAPMHFASASRTPQVVLFGPTNPFHWRPRHSPAAILRGGGVVREFQPRSPSQPMNAISTVTVIDAMRAMLSAPTASAV